METLRPLSVLLLAHDLDDPAIVKRALMLEKGGASVTHAGFRRKSAPVGSADKRKVLCFGQTFNGAFLHRIWSVLRTAFLLRRYRTLFEQADIVLARNLEMLALAVRGKALSSKKPAIVYECLDIHRLLTQRSLLGKALRNFEGWLGKRACALLTSSPAFIRAYYKALSKLDLPIRLVENKLFPSIEPEVHRLVPEKGPWRIGWFGILRCRKSFDLLRDLVEQSQGKIEVVLRGKPAPDVFPHFEEDVAKIPGFRYDGIYKHPEDLPSMYANVDFVWAIDFFEEGLNSEWLLPNRLYEGPAFGAIPLAREKTETALFLNRVDCGVVLKGDLSLSLKDFFGSLSREALLALRKKIEDKPRSFWVCDEAACKDLVLFLQNAVLGKAFGAF